MMRLIILSLIFISFSFSSNLNIALMNDIKDVIQKEEYISLAINKYILQNGKVPKKSDNTLDWDKLMVDDYLGTNFNKYNPITKKNMLVIFDSNNSAFIKGVFETDTEYKPEYNYLYNFYLNKIFRVNTIPPENNTKPKLLIGSQVLYNKIQKNIINVINENKHKIFLPTQNCETANFFYELENEMLKYKYCKTPTLSIDVYQESPIYLDNLDDLKYIKVEIGEKAYIKDGISWYEYYYEGSGSWIPIGSGKTTGQINDEINIEDRILSYIPDSKDLVLKPDSGCMLANGDIFCWGNNKYKKAGIQNYGQLDTSLKPDYVNTPVMLKVQIEDTEQSNKKWYNNPYRVKFEKMAMNSRFVCGISPIFDYYELGIRYKKGGDLYCNGSITSTDFFTDITDANTGSSILSKSKAVAKDKNGIYNSNALYIKDIAMVEGTLSILADTGIIYTVGSNDKGARGIDSTDGTIYNFNPTGINPSGTTFKKIFALRDIKGFGALDTNNYFWIWGERANGKIYYKPQILSNSKRFDENSIFVNSKDFVLKGLDNRYYRTYSDISINDLGLQDNSALSVSIYDFNGKELVVYVDKNMQLKTINSDELITCKDKDFNNCNSTDNNIFHTAFNELNNLTNDINNAKYANFSNVSIFESNVNKNVIDYGTDIFDNFETSNNNWKYIDKYNNQKDAPRQGNVNNSNVLGLFGKQVIETSPNNAAKQSVYKNYNLGSSFANQYIKISFDAFVIGSWDADNPIYAYTDKFLIYINDNVVRSDMFGDYKINGVWTTKDTHPGTNISVNVNSNYNYGKKHFYEFTTKADSSGSIKLGFGALLNDTDYYEFFAIDNVRISKKIDNSEFLNGEYIETFENNNYDSWIIPYGVEKNDSLYSQYPKLSADKYPIYDGGNNIGKFLGRFGRINGMYSKPYYGGNDGTEQVYKIFSFGSNFANKKINLDFDVYLIDKWYYNPWDKSDNDSLYLFINDSKNIIFQASDKSNYTNLTNVLVLNSEPDNDLKMNIKKEVTLDSYGNIKIGFGSFNKYGDREIINRGNGAMSWGIDNIKFSSSNATNPSEGNSPSSNKLPFICTMTGIGSASQMYCWGNIGRSIPILSTSLYDVDKISTINKLFITQESEKSTQMAFENFNNAGSLFLKYPTYIGGFDYPFYFK